MSDDQSERRSCDATSNSSNTSPRTTLFCVLDFEATCQQNDRSWKPEVIEFPSVLYRYYHLHHQHHSNTTSTTKAVNTSTKGVVRDVDDSDNDDSGVVGKPGELVEVDRIQRFCRPQYLNGDAGKLTQFCTELTGIQQEQVDGGTPFPEVLSEHEAWINERKLFPEEDVVFVTCGNWDLKTMMPRECGQWGIRVPEMYKQFINIKLMLGRLKSTRVRGMVQVLELTGLDLLGRHHSGIDDCVNIGRAFQVMASWGALEHYQPHLNILSK